MPIRPRVHWDSDFCGEMGNGVGVGWMGVPHSDWGLVRKWWLLPRQ